MLINSVVDGEPIAYLMRKSSIDDERSGNEDKKQLLQVCGKRLPAGKRFAPHRHLPTIRETVGTQEAWVVIEGRVVVVLYDIDDRQIEAVALDAGDCLVTYRGGHAMTSTKDSVLYEIKNGPYRSAVHDKVFI